MFLKLLNRLQNFAPCSLYRILKIIPLDAPKLHKANIKRATERNRQQNSNRREL